jgi:hypothetical protein
LCRQGLDQAPLIKLTWLHCPLVPEAENKSFQGKISSFTNTAPKYFSFCTIHQIVMSTSTSSESNAALPASIRQRSCHRISCTSALRETKCCDSEFSSPYTRRLANSNRYLPCRNCTSRLQQRAESPTVASYKTLRRYSRRFCPSVPC